MGGKGDLKSKSGMQQMEHQDIKESSDGVKNF